MFAEVENRIGENTVKTKALAVDVCLFCCLALSMNVQAQDSGVAGKIKQLQEEAINAQIKNDTSFAEKHLADGFIAGYSWGQWATKAEYIKQLKTTKWKSGKISDLRVATFGANTAVSHYKFTYDATFDGAHRARAVICSDTWVNESGAWKSAATHCSVAEGK
jgi:Domain of unknown function (DUF4440)